MELVNEMYLEEAHISPAAMKQILNILTLMLAPFAPYLAAGTVGGAGRRGRGIQVSRGRISIRIWRANRKSRSWSRSTAKCARGLWFPPDTDEQGLIGMAKDDERIQALVAEKTVVKVIAVPGQTDQSRREIDRDKEKRTGRRVRCARTGEVS